MKNKVIGLVALYLVSLTAFSQTATIDLNQIRQEIKGFGGINHPIWYSDLNAAERNLCYGNGDGQMGLTILRVYVSDNPNEWPRGLETAKRAVELGAIVFASPWNPPVSMTYTDSEGQKRIRRESFADYARHLNDYVTYMRNNGVELYAISTQNEPDYAHDWTEWTPQESVDFIKGYANQIDCRLMTPESFQYRKNVYDPILNDPVALANVDIFGTHLYGTQLADFPYPLFQQKGAGKELWMTEVYTDSQNDANLWDLALNAADHINNAMIEGQFQAYVWWPLRRYYALIHDGEGGHGNANVAAAGTITKRGYCFAQFSKFIRPGAVRVEATKVPTFNVTLSAYKKDHQVTIVAVNKSVEAKTFTISIPGTTISTWERYVTTGSKSISKETNINGSSSFQVTLEPKSVTTFVGSSSVSLPDVSMITPTMDTAVVIPSDVYLEAEVSDPTAINTLRFIVNGEQVGATEYHAPYFTTLNITSAGTYEVTAVITDANGNQKTSGVRTITAHVPQTPYNNIAHPIPGTIQVEEFDVGGNGFAYFDSSPGSETAVSFRTGEDVDMENCTDAGGGYNIGWATAGEWLEYTVNVDQSGVYDLELRVACNGDNRNMRILMDGVDITGNVAIPNTAGWQVWQTVAVNGIDLTAGGKIMRIVIGEVDYINLNYVTFTESTVTGNKGTEEGDFECFPNPYRESVTIKKSGEFTFLITDVTGAVVETGHGQAVQSAGAMLPSGVYFLMVKDATGVQLTKKIIKQ